MAIGAIEITALKKNGHSVARAIHIRKWNNFIDCGFFHFISIQINLWQ